MKTFAFFQIVTTSGIDTQTTPINNDKHYNNTPAVGSFKLSITADIGPMENGNVISEDVITEPEIISA